MNYNKKNRDSTDKKLYIASIFSLILIFFWFIFICNPFTYIDDKIFFLLLNILCTIFLATSFYFIIRLNSKNKKTSLTVTTIYSLISPLFMFRAYMWIFAILMGWKSYLIYWLTLTIISLLIFWCGIVWILYSIIKIIWKFLKYLHNKIK